MFDNCAAGDALRMSFCLNQLRERHPGARIVVVASEAAFPMFQHSRLCNRVVISQIDRIRGRIRLWVRLRKLVELSRLVRRVGTGYDLVVITWWGSNLLDLLAWIAAPRGARIGYAHGVPRLLTSRLGRFDFRADEVSVHLRLLEAAGVDTPRSGPPAVWIGEPDEAAAAALLLEHDLNGSSRMVILHPGSDWACQQWLPERWAQLADALTLRHGVTILFTGLPEEVAYIERIQARMASPSVSLAGRTLITTLPAVIRRARLTVCVDSTVFVLTQALGAPAVVLAGPSSPGRLAGRGRRPVVVNRTGPALRAAILDSKEPKYPDGGCHRYSCPMAGLPDISVADVLQAADTELTADTTVVGAAVHA